MPIIDWTEPDDFERFLADGGTGFIFKHSTRCDISADAEGAFERFAEENPDAPAFRVLVIENRPASNAIAESLGVRHASPQAILLRDGRAVWNASHWEITEAALAEAWSS